MPRTEKSASPPPVHRDNADAIRQAAIRLVRESRLEQGLPPTITDPAVLSRLATLIASVGARAPS